MTQMDWSNRNRDTGICCFYTHDAEKDTIINDDEKFQQINEKTTNPPYLAYGCSNQFGS